jgi:hypothetical protein
VCGGVCHGVTRSRFLFPLIHREPGIPGFQRSRIARNLPHATRVEADCWLMLACAAWYSWSLTGSSHVALIPLSCSTKATWHIMLSRVPPCQCSGLAKGVGMPVGAGAGCEADHRP